MVISLPVALEIVMLAAKVAPPLLEAFSGGGEIPDTIEIDEQHVSTSALDFLKARTTPSET